MRCLTPNSPGGSRPATATRSGWVLELDRGYGIPWEGNYSSWLEQKEQRLAVEAKQEVARIKAMQKELEWVRQNSKGRQAKSKARLARLEELSSYENQKRNDQIFIPVAERLGDSAIELKGVSKGDGVEGDLLRRQLPGVRNGQGAAARRRSGQANAHPLQAANGVMAAVRFNGSGAG